MDERHVAADEPQRVIGSETVRELGDMLPQVDVRARPVGEREGGRGEPRELVLARAAAPFAPGEPAQHRQDRREDRPVVVPAHGVQRRPHERPLDDPPLAERLRRARRDRSRRGGSTARDTATPVPGPGGPPIRSTAGDEGLARRARGVAGARARRDSAGPRSAAGARHGSLRAAAGLAAPSARAPSACRRGTRR